MRLHDKHFANIPLNTLDKVLKAELGNVRSFQSRYCFQQSFKFFRGCDGNTVGPLAVKDVGVEINSELFLCHDKPPLIFVKSKMTHYLMKTMAIMYGLIGVFVILPIWAFLPIGLIPLVASRFDWFVAIIIGVPLSIWFWFGGPFTAGIEAFKLIGKPLEDYL